MTIFGRYLFRQTAGALVLILTSLTGVVWIALALRQLNLVTSEGQDTLTFLKMTTLALPNLMVLIAPVALLIASIHTLNRLNGDSELIVLTAAGATMWNVARPLLLLGLIVSLAVSAVNHAIMPWSLRHLRELASQVRTDLINQVIEPGRFASPEPHLTFHIRDRSLKGELYGILLNDTRDPKQTMSYLAERGNIIKQDGHAYLLMRTGHIVRRSDPKEPPQIIVFDTYAVDLSNLERASSVPELKPRERFYNELVNPADDDPAFKRNPGHFRAELHERFANPLYPLAFVMLALAFAGQAQSTRTNRTQLLVTGFALAIGCRLGGLALNNLVVLRASAVPLLYGVPLAAMLVASLVMWTRARPQGGPTLKFRILFALERAIPALGRRQAAKIESARLDGAKAAAKSAAARTKSARAVARSAPIQEQDMAADSATSGKAGRDAAAQIAAINVTPAVMVTSIPAGGS
jgi:lipopolysaccharide export system permease protein